MELIVDESDVGGKVRKFVKGEYLGKGGFAVCFKVRECSGEKKEFACKIISKKDFEGWEGDTRKQLHAQNKKVKLEREVRI